MADDNYAIVETGGKQYRAGKGDTLVVERLPDDEGAKVSLRAVMFRGDKDVVLDADGLEKVKVEAVVAEHLRGPKVRVFKHRPKKGYRRTAGHRQDLTKLEVTDVKMLTRKPAGAKKEEPEAKAETTAAPKAEPAAKPQAETAAKPKAPAKPKPAAKKPAAKKPAARKRAAKKPAAKKPAASTRKTSTTRAKKDS